MGLSADRSGTGSSRSASPRAIRYRLFRETDLPEMMRIQQENLIWNLAESDRGSGFLSVEFPPDQIRKLHRGVPVLVADRGESLGGFLMGSTLEDSSAVPILARMIALYPALRFDGRRLSTVRSYVYGPVCVDAEVRGQGVLEGLFSICLGQLAGRFDVGVSFIADENPRSFEAHRRKLGMQRIGEFEFGEKLFHILAFRIPEPELKG